MRLLIAALFFLLLALQELRLGRTPVNNLAPLAGLTNLQTLNLSEADGVTDLTPLKDLTALEMLNLWYTQVSEEEMDALRTALPNLEISWR